MTMMFFLLCALLVALMIETTMGFSVLVSRPMETRLGVSRRDFCAAAVIVPNLLLQQPAFADDVDDLAMPSPEEEAAKQKAAMEERLRKKAELQKRASKPVSFADSLKGEKEKQKELQKTKEERRRALCEELGRGC